MEGKGLDFKHKEVIDINTGKRMGFVQDVCADLETPVTFSSYATTTYNNRTYAKVIMPLKNGSTCYVSDCSNLPS